MVENYLELSAPVFNVQTYSIHDGPGIRVTVFEKGCPLRCLWCANPESNLSKPQLMTYANKCTGCGRCVKACKNGAITVKEVKDSYIAVTDRTICTECGDCVDACLSEAREIAGEMMTVKEVLDKVQRDRRFIDATGGGITISGGECLVHPDFTEALLYAAKETGLHTAVETSCFGKREVVDQVFRYVDLAMIDIKHMDPEKHKEYTGVSNELILDNIKHVHNDLHIPTMISIPTITGYNDSDENIGAAAAFIANELGTDVRVRLLPYHRLGESKNESLGKEMDLTIDVPSKEHMNALKELVESFGIQTQIGG